MTKTPLRIRTALVLYGSALRLTGHRTLAIRRDEVLQSFREACLAAGETRGVSGVLARTISELWDLIASRLFPRQSAVSTGTPPPTSPSRGSWTIATDCRHAYRALLARRLDTGLAVGLLALGLVTTGSIFAVADALLLNPVPFPHADRLVQVWSALESQGMMTPSVPRDLAVRWLDRTDLFTSGGAYSNTSVLVTGNGDPELIPAIRVSPGLFETLGVRPMIGRNFTDDDGTDHVVIIAADIWASRFGQSPDVLGKTLHINDADYTVIGVMARDFRFPYSLQRIWLPFDLRHPPANLAAGMVTLTARLRPDVTKELVTEQVKAAGPAMAAAASRPWKFGATTHFLGQVSMDSQTGRSIWLLFGATVLLMLTVCANVANLGLSQAFSRTRDVAIRTALGASRGRMIRQMLIEQLAIGMLALAIAVPVTTAALTVTGSLLPRSYTFGSLNPVGLDWRLFATMLSLGIVAPLLAGLVPAVAGSKPSVLGALKQESRSVAGSKAARRFRQTLVILEVTCSVVLLVSASLLVRSFIRLQSADVGFESRNLVSASIGFPTAHFGDPVSRDLFLDQALERLRQVPGVTAAAAGSGVPPENGGISFGDLLTDATASPVTNVVVSTYAVQPNFFKVVGIPIRRGRALMATDSRDQIVISEGLATKLFPGQSAVGHRVRWDESKSWKEIVGVAATVRESTGAQALPQYYSLVEPRATSDARPGDAIADYAYLAVRVTDPASTMPLIRSALKTVNASVLVQSVDRVDDLLGKDLDRPRFLLGLMLVFAVAGLVLAAVGVYAVLSCLVAEQLREYGIRLMLGASPASISRTILAGGLGTTALGLILGFAIAAALGSTINSVLFDVQPHDVMSYVVVAVVLALAALAAAWRPALRARHVDPAVLLRNE